MGKSIVFVMGCAMVFAALGLAAGARGASLEVAGSPTYDPATQAGFKDGEVPYMYGSHINDSGTAVGYATNYVSGVNEGYRAVRWDASGTAATELGNLGTDNSGATNAYAYAVNSAGTAVGYATKYVGGTSKGTRAVRWDASGTVTELGNLGIGTNGIINACAYAVNNSGTAVGYSYTFDGVTYKGLSAVRWDASGTATELGNLGYASNGHTFAYAYAVNSEGTAVGYAQKFMGGLDKGRRAVRWDATGTAATELGNLGTYSSGVTYAFAIAVNSAGTAVGYADKYVNFDYKGVRAVRWDASGTAATELGNLWTGTNDISFARAYAVNNAGTAVGYAEKYVGSTSKGIRAIRWDASGTAATELGNLGTDNSGATNAYAYAVNSVGAAVGYAEKYVGGTDKGSHATIWLPDASVVDLNDLGVVPVPAGGAWTLTTAKAMSEDGFVAGEGSFDPDGDGPLAAYNRLWVAQVGLGGNWTQVSGGVWGRGPNWSTGTPAMQVGNARFNLPGSYAVALDHNERTKSVAVESGTVALNLGGYALSTESGLDIAPGAALQTAGTIHGDVRNSGALALSGTTGNLKLDGNLTNAGTLTLDIAALSSFDKLDVSGTLTAGGTIAVALQSGYQPALGDRFDLLDSGTFADLGYTFDFSAASLPVGWSWDTTSFATNGTIVVVPEPSALLLLALASLALFHWCKAIRKS